MNYAEIKNLDEESLQMLQEGTGPSDQCICSLLSPAEDTKKGIKASIKRAFASITQGKKGRDIPNKTGEKTIELPLLFSKGGEGVYTTKEVVERTSKCGKCGCDNERFVLKHSFAKIRITSPDVSSICPCPSDCLPDKQKFADNIKVTIEHVDLEAGYGREDAMGSQMTMEEPMEDDSDSAQLKESKSSMTLEKNDFVWPS